MIKGSAAEASEELQPEEREALRHARSGAQDERDARVFRDKLKEENAGKAKSWVRGYPRNPTARVVGSAGGTPGRPRGHGLARQKCASCRASGKCVIHGH